MMLTHGNLLHQIQLRFAPTKKYDISEPLPGDVMVRCIFLFRYNQKFSMAVQPYASSMISTCFSGDDSTCLAYY